MPRCVLVLALALCGLPLANAASVTGRGGLDAVAFSADGKAVAVGGQNRVVYLVDSATLSVTKRLPIGARVSGLAFSRDGSRLLVEDETDTLSVIDLASGKTLHSRAFVSNMLAHAASGRVVVRDLREAARNRLWFLSLDRLGDDGVVDLLDRPVAWALDSAGKRLTVLGEGRATGDERGVPLSEIPRDLKGPARTLFRLRNDGYVGTLWQVEVPTGKVVRSTQSWYTSDYDSTVIARPGDVTYVLNRTNVCARIAADGTTALFETPHRLNHALAVSPDNQVLLAGGLGEGSHGRLGADKRQLFTLPPLPGQAEFFNRFAVLDDGSAWGVTTAYRLVRINKDGQVEKVAAVY